MSSSKYLQILASNTETLEPVKTNMKAYRTLLTLSETKRQLFSDFVSEQQRTKTADAVRAYLVKFGASPMGLRMGDQAKTILLKNVHHNFHKTALLSAVGQAYIDLCLGVSIAEFCSSEAAVDLSYNEYISYINKSFDKLQEEMPKISEVCRLLPIGKDETEMYPLIFALSEGTLNISVARKRVETAIKILNLYHSNRIKYNELYEDVLEGLEEKVKSYVQQSEDEIFFAHVVTVLRNKDSFTDEQISHVNEVYTNRFTDEQKEAHKTNIPAQTPDITSTQAFFFKSNNKKNELIDLV